MCLSNLSTFNIENNDNTIAEQPTQDKENTKHERKTVSLDCNYISLVTFLVVNGGLFWCTCFALCMILFKTLKKASQDFLITKPLILQEKELQIKESQAFEKDVKTSSSDSSFVERELAFLENLKKTANACKPKKQEKEVSQQTNNKVVVKPTWNVENLSHQTSFRIHKDYINTFSFMKESNGNKYLITGSHDKKLKIWNLNQFIPTPQFVLETNQVYATACFVVKGRTFLASAGYNHDIEIYNLATQKLEFCLQGHFKSVEALQVYKPTKLSRTTFLVSGSRDKTIKIWNLTLKTCVGTLYGHKDFIKCLQVYENNGQQFLASGSFDKTIKIWNLSKKKLIATGTGHTKLIVAIKVFYSNKKPWLASGSKDGTIRIWNLKTYKLEKTFKTGNESNAVSLVTFNNLAKCFLACGCSDSTIQIWNLENYQMMKTFKVSSIAWSLTTATITSDKKDASYLISGHKDGTISFWTC